MTARQLLLLTLALAGGLGVYALGRNHGQAAAIASGVGAGSVTDYSGADQQTPAVPGVSSFTGTTNPVHVPGGYI